MRDEEKAANLRKNKQKKNQKRKQNRAIDQTKQNQDKPNKTQNRLFKFKTSLIQKFSSLLTPS